MKTAASKKSKSIEHNVASAIESLENEVDQLVEEIKKTEDHARAEQSAGDTIYDAIFNLDIKNPHTVDDGPGDPDALLAELESIRAASRQTLEELKNELAAALSR